MSIVVKPIEGMLTRDTDTFTKMDPFCVVMYGNNTRKTCAQQGAGKKPRWSETFVFQRTNDQLLRVQVWDEDAVSNDMVGQGTVNLMKAFNAPNVIQNGTDPASFRLFIFVEAQNMLTYCIMAVVQFQGQGMGMMQGGMGMNMGWQQQQMMNPMLGQQQMAGGWGQPMGQPVYNNGWNPNQGGFGQPGFQQPGFGQPGFPPQGGFNNGWNPNQGGNGW